MRTGKVPKRARGWQLTRGSVRTGGRRPAKGYDIEQLRELGGIVDFVVRAKPSRMWSAPQAACATSSAPSKIPILPPLDRARRRADYRLAVC
jgi:hypothetical protein